jgi:N-acetylmuramoyl-L-alanine amidase
VFCARTEAAVRSFQDARGMRVDGVCDETTWTALVEANWKLGDRMLLLTSPNMRGDDVAELQDGLNHIGFSCGRVDGILGPLTSRALQDFQRNCGLHADAVCGTDTVRALAVVRSQSGSGPGVQVIRERELLREGLGSMHDCRVVVGQFSGLSALTRSLARELRLRGATVMPLDEPDAMAQAVAANQFAAHCYIGFESSAEATAVAHFYQVPTFESVGGRALAEAIVQELHDVAALRPTTAGMRLPVLRETRMPAVLFTAGPVHAVADATPTIVAGVVRAVELWISRAT